MKIARKFVDRWSRVVFVLLERRHQYDATGRLGLSRRDLRAALGRPVKNAPGGQARK